MSSRVPIVAFPEDVVSATTLLRQKQHQTLRYLVKLLYSSGYVLAGVYLVAILALKPLLRLNYERRMALSNHVYSRLTSVYTRLTKKVKFVPSVVVNYKGVVYKDSMCSTETSESESQEHTQRVRVSSALKEEPVKEVRFSDEAKDVDYRDLSIDSTVKLALTLDNLKQTMQKLRVCGYKSGSDSYTTFGGRLTADQVSEMRPLMFQVKQFRNYLEMVSSDHPRDYLFKRKINYSTRKVDEKHSLNALDDLKDELDDLKNLVSI